MLVNILMLIEWRFNTVLTSFAPFPTGRLQDLGLFDVQVSYMPDESLRIVHDVIHDCTFDEVKAEWKEGDASAENELTLIVSNITWGKL